MTLAGEMALWMMIGWLMGCVHSGQKGFKTLDWVFLATCTVLYLVGTYQKYQER